MQLEAQQVLEYYEKAGGICVFDTEATGLAGDYSSILVGTVKPLNNPATTFVVSQPGHDSKVVRQFRDELKKYPVWISYYGKGFDVPMLQARLLYHGLDPLVKNHHIDLYFQLKSKVKTSRRSQAHLLDWLGTPERKLSVSAGVWNLESPRQNLATLVERCESDCAGLEAMYHRVKHLIIDVTR